MLIKLRKPLLAVLSALTLIAPTTLLTTTASASTVVTPLGPGGGGNTASGSGAVTCSNGNGYYGGREIFSYPYTGCGAAGSGGRGVLQCPIGLEVWRFYGTAANTIAYVTTSVVFLQPPASSVQTSGTVSTVCDRTSNSSPISQQDGPFANPGSPGIAAGQPYSTSFPNPADTQPSSSLNPFINMSNTSYTDLFNDRIFIDNSSIQQCQTTGGSCITTPPTLNAVSTTPGYSSCQSFISPNSSDSLYKAYYGKDPILQAKAKSIVQSYYNAYYSMYNSVSEASAAADVAVNASGQVTTYYGSKSPYPPCSSPLDMNTIQVVPPASSSGGAAPTTIASTNYGTCSMPLTRLEVPFYGPSSNGYSSTWSLEYLGPDAIRGNPSVQYVSYESSSPPASDPNTPSQWRSFIYNQVLNNPIQLPHKLGVIGQPITSTEINNAATYGQTGWPVPSPSAAAKDASINAYCVLATNPGSISTSVPKLAGTLTAPAYFRVGGALKPEQISASVAVKTCAGCTVSSSNFSIAVIGNNGYTSFGTTNKTVGAAPSITAGFYAPTDSKQSVSLEVTGTAFMSMPITVCAKVDPNTGSCLKSTRESITVPVPPSDVTISYPGGVSLTLAQQQNNPNLLPQYTVVTGTTAPQVIR